MGAVVAETKPNDAPEAPGLYPSSPFPNARSWVVHWLPVGWRDMHMQLQHALN